MIQERKKRTHIQFGCLLCILLLLIMVRYAFQIDIPRIIFLLIIAMIAIFGDRNEIIAMCICCIPLHESIDFYYALVICMVVYVFKYHRSFSFGANLVLFLIVMSWELLHCFSTSFHIIQYLSYIVPFALLALLMASNIENIDYPFIVRAFAISTLALLFILFVRVLYFSDFNFVLAIAQLQRLGSDNYTGIQDVVISGGQINSNSLGIISVLASTGLMQLRSIKTFKKSDAILMCSILVFAALGTSRTYLACLALMIILLIFAEKGDFVTKLRLIAFLFIAVGAAVAAMAVFFPDTFAYFVSRFFVDDITTGRDDLMVRYHAFIVSNSNVLFFGIGLQDFGNRLVYYYKVAGNAPHNALQEILIAWGIPGLIIFVTQFFYMHRESIRQNRYQSLLNWIPLIILLFKGMAGQLLTSGYTLLALSFAYLSLCQDFSTAKQQTDYKLVKPKADL